MGRRTTESRALRVLLLLGVLFHVCGAAHAQGFMVRPMSVNFAAEPRQTVTTSISCTNTSQAVMSLAARLQILTQAPAGSWAMLDPNSPDAAKAGTRSCLEWTTVDQSKVDVEPAKTGQFGLTFKVPVRAQGAYSCAIVIASSPRAGAGIGVVFQFLIPLICRVQGPVARQAVHAADAQMVAVPAREQKPATTIVSVATTNAGDTFENVGAAISVLLSSGGKWRKVGAVSVPDHGLLPGLTVRVPMDLRKNLPPGKYKIQGALRLAGALRERFEQEIDYAGDPAVKEVDYDVDLLIDPSNLEIVSRPGARRAAMLTIQNPSPSTVHIRCGAVLPKPPAGLAMADIKGEDFTCVPWMKITPDDFQLAAGGKRTLRVDVAWPAEETKLPVHYANVIIVAGYGSGSSAGRFVVPLAVRDGTAKPEAKAEGGGIDISMTEPNRCAVTARFTNIGLVEWTPTASLLLATPGGGSVADVTPDLDVAVVLPLGQVQLSGTLDLGKVQPGTYALQAKLTFAGTSAEQVVGVRVEMKDKAKVASVIPTTAPAAPAPGGAK